MCVVCDVWSCVVWMWCWHLNDKECLNNVLTAKKSTGKLPNADNKDYQYIRMGESGAEAIESVHQAPDHGRTPGHDYDYKWILPGLCLDL